MSALHVYRNGSHPKWVMSEVGHSRLNQSIIHDKVNIKDINLKKKLKSNIGVFHVKTVCICLER